MRRKDAARVQVGEQVLHGEQGMDFRRGEPQARQFVLASKLGLLCVEPVTAGKAVEDNRGVQPVAHVLQIPPQGGTRDLQCIRQLREGDQLAVRDHLVDFVEAFGLVHLSPGLACLCIIP